VNPVEKFVAGRGGDTNLGRFAGCSSALGMCPGGICPNPLMRPGTEGHARTRFARVGLPPGLFDVRRSAFFAFPPFRIWSYLLAPTCLVRYSMNCQMRMPILRPRPARCS